MKISELSIDRPAPDRKRTTPAHASAGGRPELRRAYFAVAAAVGVNMSDDELMQ